eukprot:scaffold60728_cov62-Attheya_sp.AAC.2
MDVVMSVIRFFLRARPSTFFDARFEKNAIKGFRYGNKLVSHYVANGCRNANDAVAGSATLG